MEQWKPVISDTQSSNTVSMDRAYQNKPPIQAGFLKIIPV